MITKMKINQQSTILFEPSPQVLCYKKLFFFVLFSLLVSHKSFSQCFEIESILVDACALTEEGTNEMVRFKIGSTAQNTNNLVVVWPNNAWQGLIQDANTAVKVALINQYIDDAGGCGNLLEPVAGVLPANAKVILVTSQLFDIVANPFGALSENTYIIFQNNLLVTAGHFANYGTTGNLFRTLTINFGACSDTVTYNRSLLKNQAGANVAADGATVNFNSNGDATYITNGCVAPVAVSTNEGGNTAVIACVGGTISLNGTAAGQTSVTWSAASGTFTNPNSLSTDYQIAVPAGTVIVLTLTAYFGLCENTATMTVTVTPKTAPTFSQVPTVCSGGTISALPTTSTNGITGIWSPSINNNETTTYTFMPTEGQCANTATMTISIISTSVTASVSSLNTSFECPGNQTSLIFNGTPNAIVTFNSSENVGPPYLQVTLDNNGNAIYLTPPINNTTIFNLMKVENSSCTNNLSGFVRVSLTYANSSLTSGTAFLKVEGPDIICEKFDDTSPIPQINIAATFNTIKTTSNYTVQSIPYQPQFNFESPNTIPIPTTTNTDDFWSGATVTTPYTLPFNFGFYGTNYDKLTVGSNGVLSFNLAYQTLGNICPYVFPNNIPDAGAPIKNAIFGVYQDINYNPPLPTSTSSINYYVFPQLGCVQAKNRVFVMNTNKTYLFGDSTGTSSGLQSYQIIMYETTNIIDVVVKRRKNATTWQGKLGIIGLINSTGLQAIAAPGRNRNDAWQSLAGEAWRFIPSGTSKYTLKWYKNGVFITEELNPTVLPNGQVQSTITVPPVHGDFYTAKLVIQPVTAGDPAYNLEDTYVVNISATKFKKPLDINICGTNSNGDFVFNINQNNYMANGAFAGNFDFGYYNSMDDAKFTINSINDITALVLPAATTTFPKTIFVNANDIASSCNTLLQFNLFGIPKTTPTFTTVAASCANATLTALPTTSTNGITGTWSPALNNNTTTTYTFTPTAGQCANTTTQTITVANPSVTSAISFVAPVAALPSVTIGNQVWTNKNLDVTTYRDGTPIPQVTDPTAWANLTTGAWCYYNNDPANGAIYGKLYNWYAVAGIHDNDPNTPNKILAPLGWHVPSDPEWTVLTDYLGGQLIAGGKMKETGTVHWNSPNQDATNSSGFTGLPGGVRFVYGIFNLIGIYGYWWSSSENDTTFAWTRGLKDSNGVANRDSVQKYFFESLRLIKD